jgi:alcohol/geraniol dehydrogenase (NADP+)
MTASYETTVHALAAVTPGAELTPYEYRPDGLAPLEVEITVTHCGVCATDLRVIDAERPCDTPVVPGHEVAGTVAAVGDLVDPAHVWVGQRVVAGGVSGACMACEFCLTGRTHLCPRRESMAHRGDRGGFASSVRVSDWRFVYPLPDAIDLAHAGPFLCAGATVFAPFLRHGITASQHVAVSGIGGLGHLAIQFARAWGCEVTAISSSADKADQARRLGAHHFVKGSEIAAAAGTFDVILSTASGDLPWDDYIAALRPQGVLVLVGAPEQAMRIDGNALLHLEKRISGGVAAARQEVVAMLDFAARTGIRPLIETFPAAEINEAVARVRSNTVRFRAVVAM